MSGPMPSTGLEEIKQLLGNLPLTPDGLHVPSDDEMRRRLATGKKPAPLEKVETTLSRWLASCTRKTPQGLLNRLFSGLQQLYTQFTHERLAEWVSIGIAQYQKAVASLESPEPYSESSRRTHCLTAVKNGNLRAAFAVYLLASPGFFPQSLENVEAYHELAMQAGFEQSMLMVDTDRTNYASRASMAGQLFQLANQYGHTNQATSFKIPMLATLSILRTIAEKAAVDFKRQDDGQVHIEDIRSLFTTLYQHNRRLEQTFQEQQQMILPREAKTLCLPTTEAGTDILLAKAIHHTAGRVINALEKYLRQFCTFQVQVTHEQRSAVYMAMNEALEKSSSTPPPTPDIASSEEASAENGASPSIAMRLENENLPENRYLKTKALLDILLDLADECSTLSNEFATQEVEDARGKLLDFFTQIRNCLNPPNARTTNITDIGLTNMTGTYLNAFMSKYKEVTYKPSRFWGRKPEKLVTQQWLKNVDGLIRALFAVTEQDIVSFYLAFDDFVSLHKNDADVEGNEQLRNQLKSAYTPAPGLVEDADKPTPTKTKAIRLFASSHSSFTSTQITFTGGVPFYSAYQSNSEGESDDEEIVVGKKLPKDMETETEDGDSISPASA